MNRWSRSAVSFIASLLTVCIFIMSVCMNREYIKLYSYFLSSCRWSWSWAVLPQSPAIIQSYTHVTQHLQYLPAWVGCQYPYAKLKKCNRSSAVVGWLFLEEQIILWHFMTLKVLSMCLEREVSEALLCWGQIVMGRKKKRPMKPWCWWDWLTVRNIVCWKVATS